MNSTQTVSDVDDEAPFERRSMGRRIGRYLVIEQIGEGGAGVVCRAYDPELDRQVAIKVLRHLTGSGHATASERLRREAQAIARLHHAHVVSVYDVGTHEGEVFVAMELVDGGSVKTWLEGGRDVASVLDVFIQAGQGLEAAHDKGIVHRDFKPSNVLIGRDGVVRVADFGLARGVKEPIEETKRPASVPDGLVEHTMTRSDQLLGTPAYMAPEQLLGAKVDARADQYAYCLALAEAVLNQRGRDAVKEELLRDRPMGRDGTRISVGLRDVLRKGLADEPEDRFRSMREVLGRLTESRRRRARGALLVAVMVIIVGVGAAYVGYRQSRPRCDRFFEDWAAVWGPEQARQVRVELSQSGGAEAGGAAIVQGIEAYGKAWVATRQRVCEATHDHGVQSAQLLDLRMQCLDRRLEQIGALVGILGRGSIDPENASEAVLRLAPVSRCAERTPFNGLTELPRSDAERAELAALERTFLEAEALWAAGLLSEGLVLTSSVIPRAERLGLKLPLSDAHLWRAKFLAAHDRVKDARRLLTKAATLADGARDDERRMRFLIAKIELDPGERETQAETEADLARAEAVLQRLEGDVTQEVALLSVRARASQRWGRLEDCRKEARRALDRLEAMPAIPLWDRLAGAELLAACLEQAGFRKEAVVIIDGALEIAVAELGARHPRIARLWIQASRARDFSGDPVGAQRAAENGLALAKATLGPDHSVTGAAWHALSNVHSRAGRYEIALEASEHARSAYEKSFGPQSRQVATMLSNNGYIYRGLGQKEKAFASHEAAVAIFIEVLGPNHPETGGAYGLMGSTYRAFGACAQAVPLYRKVIEILSASDPMHARILDQIRGLGECFLRLGKPNDAWDALEKGFPISQARDETPYFTALLELLSAKALWDGPRERKRAMAFAKQARDRLKAYPAYRELYDEASDWIQIRTAE